MLHPTWQLANEISFQYRAGLSSEELYQPILEHISHLGLQQAQLQRLKTDILRAAQSDALTMTDQAEPALTIIVRVFIKKRDLPGRRKRASPWGKSGPHQNPLPIPLSGGWGYFLIGRSIEQADAFPQSHSYLIELFLYKEGR